MTAELLPALRALEARWAAGGPGGYRIDIAGAVEESSKGSASIAVGIPIMLFITFTLLMLQLNSFSRAVLVFLTGPLGIAGVAGALLLFDRPFGFVALLGVIALMGMIQRNSVILIDQIEQDRSRGVPAWDAIVESAVRRLRPIVLTARRGASVDNQPAQASMFSSAAVAGDVGLMGVLNGTLQARDFDSGRLLWSFTTDAARRNRGWVLTADGAFNGPMIFATDWREAALPASELQFSVGSFFSSPLVAGGVIYVGSADGRLYALE